MRDLRSMPAPLGGGRGTPSCRGAQEDCCRGALLLATPRRDPWDREEEGSWLGCPGSKPGPPMFAEPVLGPYHWVSLTAILVQAPLWPP